MHSESDNSLWGSLAIKLDPRKKCGMTRREIWLHDFQAFCLIDCENCCILRASKRQRAKAFSGVCNKSRDWNILNYALKSLLFAQVRQPGLSLTEWVSEGFFRGQAAILTGFNLNT
jgi:hypothetical protein